MQPIPGIHHVTAIAGDPQRNIDFYTGTLGLRLVKLTVNYDDPGTYHLYYGDGIGRPGTILTFFPWRGVPQGRSGAGEATTVAFSIPANSLDYWKERLSAGEPQSRFNERYLQVADPDGMQVELVAAAEPDARPGWPEGAIPQEHAIRGIFGTALSVARLDRTKRLLGETMGFSETGRDGDRLRFEAGGGGPGGIVDLMESRQRGQQGAGSIHHIAWRTPDDQDQTAWRNHLVKAGMQVTPIIDRTYFHSIYYREPSGVLFEIATDPPGFAVDEPQESLGTRLVLPAWLEPQRNQLLRTLPALKFAEAQNA
ncbi:MAG: ring-cleaving dioxygenase [Acidobacteriota bacterium]|nr:ring-cleaving dioxygenase [Acidobacteriota bacterium]